MSCLKVKTCHCAQPPYLAVPLPQFQDHEWRAISGVLGVLIQQEVLKDKCLCPRWGCRAPEALGALAVVQEDQANEGPCRWGHGVTLSCQVRLSSLAAAATGPVTWACPGWASQPLSKGHRAHRQRAQGKGPFGSAMSLSHCHGEAWAARRQPAGGPSGGALGTRHMWLPCHIIEWPWH